VHSFLLYKNWLHDYEAAFEFIDRELRGGNGKCCKGGGAIGLKITWYGKTVKLKDRKFSKFKP